MINLDELEANLDKALAEDFPANKRPLPPNLQNVLVCYIYEHQEYWTRGYLCGAKWEVLMWNKKVEVPLDEITQWTWLPNHPNSVQTRLEVIRTKVIERIAMLEDHIRFYEEEGMKADRMACQIKIDTFHIFLNEINDLWK